MSRIDRPTINSGPASAYQQPNERIVEISNRNGGCLMSARSQDDGTLRIEIYRRDASIRVVTDESTTLELIVSAIQANEWNADLQQVIVSILESRGISMETEDDNE